MRRAKKDEEAETKMKFRVKEMVLSSISVLEWTWDRFPFDEAYWMDRSKEKFIAKIASRGNVEFVRWLREVKKCPWDKWTCRQAASNDHLDCLQYAHENGCPWNITAWQYALKNNHQHILEYLREYRAPGSN